VNRKREKPGLTLIEILTVIAIIALLIGILIPAVTAVKDAAKEVKQRGQFMTIELGLTAFKNDYGDYPQSYYGHNPPLTGSRGGGIYCGSQKMTEALLGWDLLGFHPDSDWCWDGLAAYDPGLRPATFDERKKPYLESGTQYAFKLGDLFGSALPTARGADTYVLCDVFGGTKVARPDGSLVKAGAPILYYKADPSGRFNDPALVDTAAPWDNRGNIYNCLDNLTIVGMKEARDGASVPAFSVYTTFYEYIRDPKITAKPTPYNPSSYILISAGKDGTYGTPDDIRNFGD
jgi:prepilin-type N-terminal cleavage/methylation domain-containing protein